jgi:hypothetical protein
MRARRATRARRGASARGSASPATRRPSLCASKRASPARATPSSRRSSRSASSPSRTNLALGRRSRARPGVLIIDRYVPPSTRATARSSTASGNFGAEAVGCAVVFAQAVNLHTCRGRPGLRDVDKWADRIVRTSDCGMGRQPLLQRARAHLRRTVPQALPRGQRGHHLGDQAWEMGQSPDDWSRISTTLCRG